MHPGFFVTLNEECSQTKNAGQRRTKTSRYASEHSVGYGREQARSVTAAGVRIDSSSMRKPLQRQQGPIHDFMCRATAELYDEAGAARIMVRMAMWEHSVHGL